MNNNSCIYLYINISSKAMEIHLIVYNSISMFIIIIINLIFSSLIRYWRVKNLIKTVNKKKGIIFCYISFIISLILSFGAFIELVFLNINLDEEEEEIIERDGKKNSMRVERMIGSIACAIIILLSSAEKFIWCLLKDRIDKELDERSQEQPNTIENGQNAVPNNNINPVNEVVLEQPNPSGPIVTYSNQNKNEYNYQDDKKDNNNVQTNENVLKNQINSEVPDSQELKLK